MASPFVPLFQVDDVLAFQLSDGSFRVAICAQISGPNRNGPATARSGARRTYDLVLTSYRGEVAPTVDALRACTVGGHWVDTGFDAPTLLAMQPGVDALWRAAGVTRPCLFGVDYRLVAHRDAAAFADRLVRVGSLAMQPAFKRQGGYRYVTSFADLEREFVIDGRDVLRVSDVPLAALC